jgi:hypothetical protein
MEENIKNEPTVEIMNPKKIGISEFVKRQTPESKYTHFAGTFEELAKMVEENFDKVKAGYRDGVILVPVSPERFFSGTIQVTPETELVPHFEARREGEKPYINVTAKGEKTPAIVAEIVLYRHDVLAENNEQSSDADWEIISINARSTPEEEPMTPMTMARNMLELPGGTKGTYTAEEFAKSIIYWSDKARKD